MKKEKEQLIGMGEAARILQVTEARSARRILENAGVSLSLVTARTYAVKLSDVERIQSARGGKIGKGRPRKEKPETSAVPVVETAE